MPYSHGLYLTFGLNDAIESGLVKTPRVVVRDDSERTKGAEIKIVPHLCR